MTTLALLHSLELCWPEENVSLEQLTQTADTETLNTQVFLSVARANILLHRWSKAERILRGYLQEDWQNIEILEALAIAYFYLKDFKQAKIYFLKIASLSEKKLDHLYQALFYQVKEDEDRLFQLGCLSEATFHYQLSEKCFFKAYQLHPLEGKYCLQLGLLKQKQRLFEEAIFWFQKVVALNLNDADAYFARALCYMELADFKKALEDLLFLDRAFPNHFVITKELGNCFLSLNDKPHAIFYLSKSITLEKKQPDLLVKLALLTKEIDAAQSLFYLNQCLEIEPFNKDGILNRMALLLEMRKYHEAIEYGEKALIHISSSGTLYHHFALAYFSLKQYEQAEKWMLQSLVISSRVIESQLLASQIYISQHKYDKALEHAQIALEMHENHPLGHFQVGTCLVFQERFEESIQLFSRAIELQPHFTEAYINRCYSYFNLLQIPSAIEDIHTALQLEPDNLPAQLHLASLLLLKGDYAKGWYWYESRLQKQELTHFDRKQIAPRLQDLLIGGKHILVSSEQGLGDTIQFCRFVLNLIERGAQVTLLVPPDMVQLLSTLHSSVIVVSEITPPWHFDFQIPLLSLPNYLSICSADTLYTQPYLSPSQPNNFNLKERLPPFEGLKVGVVVAGSAKHPEDKKRSFSLDHLAPIFELPIQFHLLQKEISSDDLATASYYPNVYVHVDHIHDFNDSAYLVAAMDLIVSVDTSVAHLAGAMGKPVWLCLAYIPEFRWLLDREDSPWYPSMTLIRQRHRGDWSGVVESVKEKLMKYIRWQAEVHDLPALRAKAEFFARQGDLSKAIDTYLGNFTYDFFKDIDCLHLGCWFRQLKQYPKAMDWLNKALTQSPDLWDAVAEKASCYYEMQEYVCALDLYLQLVEIKPTHYFFLKLVGICFLRLDSHQKALPFFEKSLEQEAMQPDVYANMAYAVMPDSIDLSLTYLDKAISIDKTFVAAFANKAIVLNKLLRYQDAVDCIQEAIALNPIDPTLYYTWACSLFELELYQECFDKCLYLLSLDDQYLPVYLQAAKASLMLKKYELAKTYLDHISLHPAGEDEFHFYLGCYYYFTKKFKEAIDEFSYFLQKKSKDARALLNRAVAYAAIHFFDKAFSDFYQALAYAPGDFDIQWNFALLLLKVGQYEEGWRLYESRLHLKHLCLAERLQVAPRLIQRNIYGLKIYIYAEQGLGDIIQFCRFILQLLKQGAIITLEAPLSMKGLLQTLHPGIQVIEKLKGNEIFDAQIPLLSLPFYLNAQEKDLRAPFPYLSFSKEKNLVWKKHHENITTYRVGLVVSGNSDNPNDVIRSIPLAKLQPILALNIEFHCLQMEIRPEDKEIAKAYPNVKCYEESFTDMLDTASLLVEMDLILTVDTAVAHLAGALNKPTWIMLPFASDFRWLIDREDSPWYPSVRLFRSKLYHEWDDVIHNVYEAFTRWMREVSYSKDAQKLKENPNDKDIIYWNQKAQSYFQQGLFPKAIEIWKQSLIKKEYQQDIWLYQGIAHASIQEREQALQCFHQALRCEGENVVSILIHKGLLLSEWQRFDEALSVFEYLSQNFPDQGMSFFHLAGLQFHLEQYEKTWISLQKALELLPDFAPIPHLLGSLCIKKKLWLEAEQFLLKAYSLNANLPFLTFDLGRLYFDMKQFSKAIFWLEICLSHHSQHQDVYILIGNCMYEIDRFQDAIITFSKCIQLYPHAYQARISRGATWFALKEWDKAEKDFNESIQHEQSDLAKLNKAYLCLLLGRFKEGWYLYEARKNVLADELFKKTFSVPLLTDLNVKGKQVLVFGEQGLGDMIQFSRFAKLLETKGAVVYFLVTKNLISILKSLSSNIQFIDEKNFPAFIDTYIPLMSLPGIFSIDLENIPSERKYLFVPKDKQKQWLESMGEKKRFRIGVVSQGGSAYGKDRQRSIAPSAFSFLKELDVEVHFIQKECSSEQKDFIKSWEGAFLHTEELIDFSDTAGCIEQMDLVLSVDTSVAHLSAAMGMPTWILISYVPDFRWLLDREDTPWYPTARLFRQTTFANWDEVLQIVHQELIHELARSN
ncbi:MAG: hypothetical protein EBZ47_01880 [Chlamydiae bacterium]|nr:hypothetical protein [Chlamydiota bacterium]